MTAPQHRDRGDSLLATAVWTAMVLFVCGIVGSTALQWRAQGSIHLITGLAVLPACGFTLLLGAAWAFARRRLARPAFWTGAIAVVLSLLGAGNADEPLRSWYLATHRSAFQALVERARADVRRQGGRPVELDRLEVAPTGAYSCQASLQDGETVVRIDNPCGPSLESTLVTVSPLPADRGLRPAYKDEVGYWYLLPR